MIYRPFSDDTYNREAAVMQARIETRRRKGIVVTEDELWNWDQRASPQMDRTRLGTRMPTGAALASEDAMKKAKKKKASVIDPTVMTGDALKAGIEALYGNKQSQSAFARLVGSGDRTIRSYIAGQFPVPKPIGYLVALMLRTRTKPEDLKL